MKLARCPHCLCRVSRVSGNKYCCYCGYEERDVHRIEGSRLLSLILDQHDNKTQDWIVNAYLQNILKLSWMIKQVTFIEAETRAYDIINKRGILYDDVKIISVDDHYKLLMDELDTISKYFM